jgi:hypothetical protein
MTKAPLGPLEPLEPLEGTPIGIVLAYGFL